jgi:ABC-type Fe3+ transport system permease subunit
VSRLLFLAALLAVAGASLVPLLALAAELRPGELSSIFDPRYTTLLARTIAFGLAVTALAFLLGFPFGFLVARCDVPGAGILRVLGVAPLLIPTLLLGMVWVALVDWSGPITSVWVMGLGLFPLVSLYTGRAAERIDARMEDAARLGGGRWAVLRSGFGLILPPACAGAALAFTFAVNDFAVTDYVSSVGRKFNVYADEVFNNARDFRFGSAPAEGETPSGSAAVLSGLPLVVLAGGALALALSLRRRGAMRTVGSHFRAPATIALGPWRWLAAGFAWGLVGVATLLPIGRLMWEAGGGAEWNLDTLRGAFQAAFTRAREDMYRSLVYAFWAATGATAAALVLGHAIERARHPRWARLGELIALLPIAVPPTLFAVGCLLFWQRPLTDDLLHSTAMPAILYGGHLVPFAVLIVTGAVAGLRVELEQAAQLAGAPAWQRLLRIAAPNLIGALAGAWLLVFCFSLRELDLSLVIAEANRTAIVRVFNGVHFGRDEYVAALSLLLVFAILAPGLIWTLLSKRRLEVLP